MKQNFVLNQPQNNIGTIGQTAMVVADKNGDIKYRHVDEKNAITNTLLNRMAYSIYSAIAASYISNFGISDYDDGIAFFSNATHTAGGTMMSCAKVSAATNIAYVIFSGSRTISHNGSINKFALGINWDVGGDGLTQEYATQSAAIAVSSGDTISATWTVSCSTT